MLMVFFYFRFDVKFVAEVLSEYADFVTRLLGKLFLRVVFIDFINFSPFCPAYGETKGGSPLSEWRMFFFSISF